MYNSLSSSFSVTRESYGGRLFFLGDGWCVLCAVHRAVSPVGLLGESTVAYTPMKEEGDVGEKIAP
ncbi:hypothetical protein CFELI_09280 [Corynebacterium felinum]|uniref:Uncharacterized protein n=1 Tax=Corynebacterium felinum TaxID=131318 RepID=A0ABU2BCY7_9CORY|nr:hypothetical protein [Corynebacterium felinum]WJY95460.1 hypothetical protein CFELI_09280 [Corynebacterium felinum]